MKSPPSYAILQSSKPVTNASACCKAMRWMPGRWTPQCKGRMRSSSPSADQITAKPTTMFSDATRILVTAMEKHGVKRLVCITGIGAGDSRGHGGFWYERLIFPLITKQTYLDKGRQEELIRNSSLDWIIVRPASFTNGPLRGNLRVAPDLNSVTIRSISRADTAVFVLQQVTDNTYLRKTPLVGY